jgi:hypothetical protein
MRFQGRVCLQTGLARYGQLIVLEFVNTLNEAFCDLHAARCPDVSDSEEFLRECGHVQELAEEIRLDMMAMGRAAPPDDASLCFNRHPKCDDWVQECDSNAGVLMLSRSCPVRFGTIA